jgi:glycerol-3-phosphate dehydrogenase
MVSIAGGKLTTHRRIALEALKRLPDPRLSNLQLDDTPLPGARAVPEPSERDVDPGVVEHLAAAYGRDSLAVMRQQLTHPDALERIHPQGPDVWAQVFHAVEKEWAITIEDIVRRRTTLAVRGLASGAVRAELARVLARPYSPGLGSSVRSSLRSSLMDAELMQ